MKTINLNLDNNQYDKLWHARGIYTASVNQDLSTWEKYFLKIADEILELI